MTITLSDLRFRAYHGVMPQERTVGGDYSVTVSLDVPDEACRAAIDDDDLNATINYAEVYRLIEREMARPSQLLEHVAGRIRRSLRTTWPHIAGGHVSVTKINPPLGAATAGATITLAI